MKNHLYERFDSPDQTNFLEDVIVTLISNADPRDPTEEEHYWIYTVKIKSPYGSQYMKMVSQL